MQKYFTNNNTQKKQTKNNMKTLSEIKCIILFAICQNPIIGNASGKFGKTIFQKTFNNNILRSKPLIYKQSKSIAEQTTQFYFWASVTISKSLNILLKDTFSAYLGRLNACAYFIKLNQKIIYSDQVPNVNLDWSLMQISKGLLQQFSNFGVSLVTWGTALFSWTSDDFTYNSKEYDNVTIVFIDVTNGNSIIQKNVSNRGNPDNYTLQLNFDTSLVGTALACYCILTSVDIKKGNYHASNSMFCGYIWT